MMTQSLNDNNSEDTAMETVLATHDLKKYFKSNFMIRTIKAVDGISLDIKRGEVYGVIGHNGAGKTTTIKILTGLIRASSGSAEIMGYPAGDVRSRNHIGFLPERPYFYEHLTASEALHFYGRLNKMSRAEIQRRADELFEMLDLNLAKDRPMGSYSKGMLQRFGMAMALVHDPHLVILDEPMSGLDPVGRSQIKEIIRLLKKEGKTICFSTHILSDVEQLCNRVALIARGKLLYSGTVSDLTSRYEEGTEFVFQNLNPAQVALVEGMPGHLTRRGERMVLMLQKDTDPQEILREMVQRGLTIEQMLPKRTSLEEIFVREFMKEEEAERARPDHRS